jgi:hypothetical protein
MAVARARPAPGSDASQGYLALLDRRFAALETIAAGAPAADLGWTRRDRALARRVLRQLEARWHDGDENFVRGFLDHWTGPGEDRRAVTARRLVAAATELLRIEARPQAWWFFLWEMESLLALVAGEGGC